MKKKLGTYWPVFIVIPVFLFFASFTLGKYDMTLKELISTMHYHFTDPSKIIDKNMETVLFNIRIPRVFVVLMVGAGLPIAGAAYQGMFKNPLVSPDILGASAGAGFGAAIALLLSKSMATVQIFSFCGGIIAVAMAAQINRIMKYDPILALVLGGILIKTLFTSGLSVVKFLADSENQLPAITFWLMESFASTTKSDVLPVLIPMAVSCIILFVLRWKLNVLSFGEDEAKSMGINTRHIRRWVIIASTLITASSVSVCGMIGWIGLVVPHLSRSLVGPNYKTLIPVCGILGASFLVVVDNIARCAWAVELPIGILTSLMGVPFFIIIFKRKARGWS